MRALPADADGLGAARADGHWLHAALLQRCRAIGALAWPLAAPGAANDSVVQIEARAHVGELDALILGGGGDLKVAENGRACIEDRNDRDRYEYALLRYALAARLPVLGICRGAQLIQLAHGGALQAPRTDAATPGLHCDRTRYVAHHHAIELSADGRLQRVFGRASAEVSSAHRWRIAELGNGLRCDARCPSDGSIEAFSGSAPGWLLGVLWHPEFDLEHVRALPGHLIFAHLRAAIDARRSALNASASLHVDA